MSDDFGISDQGFRPKRLNDIRREVEEKLEDTFGEDINLQDDSIILQLLAPAMAQLAEGWEMAEEVYNAFDPDQANGEALINLSRLVGLEGRIEAAPSTGEIRIEGDANTIVPMGTVVENPSTEDRFETTEEGTIPSDGSDIFVSIVAQEDGPVEAEVGSINEIVTPVDGMDAVYNETELVPGRHREMDTELRQRREDSLFIGGKSVDLAMRAELLETEGVTHAQVHSNRTLETDDKGLEPGYMAIVYPSSDDPEFRERIAETLFEAQPAGIRPNGDVELIVEDEEGIEQRIFFQFADEQEIIVEVDISHDRDYAGSDADDDVREVVETIMDDQGIGQDLRFLPFASAIQQEVDGIISIDINFENITQSESGESIDILFDQIAVLDSVDVNSIPA